MKIDILGDFSKTEPVSMEARTVVLRDEFNQPILVAQEMDNGKIFVSRAGSADFRDALISLGIEVNVKYREVKAPS
jgi:hypothetical protein